MIASTHPPTDARVAYKEAGTLIDAGHRVSFLGLDNGEYPSHNRMEVHLLPRPKNRFLRVLKGKKLARKALEIDADAYIIHDTEVLYIAKHLAVRGKTVIHDAHEPYPDFLAEKPWVPHIFKNITRKLAARAEWRGVKACQGLIVAMEANVERLKDTGTPIFVLHNYPRLQDVAEKVPDKDNSVIYVGGLMEVRRGVEILSMADKFSPGEILDGWRLDVIGPVHYNEYRRECMEAVKDHVDAEYLDFPGERKPYHEVLAMMEKARFGLSLIVPTRNYSQVISTKVFDYMAKGTIPIATWLSAYEGLISDADGPIFIKAGDEDKVPQIIADLARDESSMRQRAETCLKSVREKFNWEADAQHLPEFLERIAGKE